MTWPWEMVERDHEIQNPTNPEKIRRLGRYLRLGPTSRVLDIACGKAGPALILASTHGCRIDGIELRPAFADEARARIAAQSLGDLIEVRTADAAGVALEPGLWDAALCLGASFVWGHIGDAARALVPAVKPGGFVAVGEPFWRRWPPPDGVDPSGFVNLADTAARFSSSGVSVTGIIAGSQDDWDHYESQHWRAVEEWLAEHPDDPEAKAIRQRHQAARSDYFRFERELLGWAIFVGRT